MMGVDSEASLPSNDPKKQAEGRHRCEELNGLMLANAINTNKTWDSTGVRCKDAGNVLYK